MNKLWLMGGQKKRVHPGKRGKKIQDFYLGEGDVSSLTTLSFLSIGSIKTGQGSIQQKKRD